MSKNKGTWNKTKRNTMLAPDGKYYDPNKLESYFVEKTQDSYVNEAKARIQEALDEVMQTYYKGYYDDEK